jgi:uncharacterized protein YlxP (DUF503 family)
MLVGLLTLELHLPGCDTLKEKRHRLKGVIERARSKFNVSVTEVGHLDAHQSSLVAVSMVNNDRVMIEQVFGRVEELFANGDGLIVSDSVTEWF